MRTGLAISAVGHAAVLVWAIVTFPTTPPAIPALDSPLVEVDLVASTSQLTAGAKNAPKAEQPKPKFDPNRIEQRMALIDKRDPQRRAATGETLNPLATLGASTGNAPRLSQSEIDALRARLRDCWNLPAGAADSKDLNVEV